MPESNFSLGHLLAVGATSALATSAAVVMTQLMINKNNGKPERKSRSKRQKQAQIAEDSDDDDCDSSTSDDNIPPPPQPGPARRPTRRHETRHRRPKSRVLFQSNADTSIGFDQSAVLDSLEWGFSMEDARAHAEQLHMMKTSKGPREVLEDLQKGNARFWTGAAARPELSAFERRALIKTQFPTVAVLGCSDSRVPVEIVFDQGLGDMFVIRVAGNHLDKTTTGSLQYAILHLHVSVIVVMGHEGCGAVKAAMNAHEEIDKEPEELSNMLTEMKQNLCEKRLAWAQDAKARDREAVVTNVKAQVAELTRDKDVLRKVNENALLLVGAFYEISSGIVDFFHEVSKVEDDIPLVMTPETDAPAIRRSPSRGVQSRYDPTDHSVIPRRKLSGTTLS